MQASKLTSVSPSQPIINSLSYLAQVMYTRIYGYFDKKFKYRNVEEVPLPRLSGYLTPYTNFVEQYQLSVEEHIVLLLALAPHIRPDFLDQIITTSLPNAGDFPQIGGTKIKQFRGILPTAETALFVLAGEDLQRRFELQDMFDEDHFFAKKQILYVETPKEKEPFMSGRLILSQEYVELFTRGKVSPPKFSMDFPAQLINTQLEWKDLVLDNQTFEQIQELENWVKYGDVLLYDWGMKNKIKPGYRALFHGPPGTGKTLTASLLGKYTQKDVYKVDLSMIVSKFIGETEKNLAKLFAKAESKGWILFFDEADALFGKRTNVRDAHDKYANQEVSYLLQRVETYDGLVILASNFKSNIDEAFIRRFQSIIHFPMPKVKERLVLWQNSFPLAVDLANNVSLSSLAQKYSLTGANIVNVVQFCCIEALARGSEQISLDAILQGIQRELSKEGKIG